MENYFIGKVATRAIIAKEGKVLIARDHKDVDLWDLPGGTMDIGENIETTLQREITEELGVTIRIDRLVYSEQVLHVKENALKFFITCEVTLLDLNTKLKVPSEELAEIKWIGKDELDNMKMYENCTGALKAYWKLS